MIKLKEGTKIGPLQKNMATEAINFTSPSILTKSQKRVMQFYVTTFNGKDQASTYNYAAETIANILQDITAETVYAAQKRYEELSWLQIERPGPNRYGENYNKVKINWHNIIALRTEEDCKFMWKNMVPWQIGKKDEERIAAAKKAKDRREERKKTEAEKPQNETDENSKEPPKKANKTKEKSQTQVESNGVECDKLTSNHKANSGRITRQTQVESNGGIPYESLPYESYLSDEEANNEEEKSPRTDSKETVPDTSSNISNKKTAVPTDTDTSSNISNKKTARQTLKEAASQHKQQDDSADTPKSGYGKSDPKSGYGKSDYDGVEEVLDAFWTAYKCDDSQEKWRPGIRAEIKRLLGAGVTKAEIIAAAEVTTLRGGKKLLPLVWLRSINGQTAIPTTTVKERMGILKNMEAFIRGNTNGGTLPLPENAKAVAKKQAQQYNNALDAADKQSKEESLLLEHIKQMVRGELPPPPPKTEPAEDDGEAAARIAWHDYEHSKKQEFWRQGETWGEGVVGEGIEEWT